MSRGKIEPKYPKHIFHQPSNRDNPIDSWYEYIRVRADDKRRWIPVHRLIAVAHEILDPSEMWEDDIIIHHNSGIGLDNRPDNLERMDRSNHSKRHKWEKSKLDWSDINDMRDCYENGNITQKELAEKYGISKSQVGNIVNYRQWVRD